jgi:hypothetical protein
MIKNVNYIILLQFKEKFGGAEKRSLKIKPRQRAKTLDPENDPSRVHQAKL